MHLGFTSQLCRTWQVREDLAGDLDADGPAANDGDAACCLQPLVLGLQ